MYRSTPFRRVSSLLGLLLASAWVALVADTAEHGLVLYYPFEGNDQARLTDVSGEENHGVVRGAVRTREGKFGKAIEFPTHEVGADIPDSPSLLVENDGDGFTVSLWAYPIEWNFEGTAENRAVYRHMQYNVDFFRGAGRFHVRQKGAWPGVNGVPDMAIEQ